MSDEAIATANAYAAGLLDAKGSFYFIRGGQRARPRVSFSTTQRSLVDFLQVQLGGNVVAKRATSAGGKACWEWRQDGLGDVERTCRVIQPYLRAKAAHATCMLQYIHLAQAGKDEQLEAVVLALGQLNLQWGRRDASAA